MYGGVRAGVAACARRRRHSGGAGRSGRTRRSPAQFCSAEQPGRHRREYRGGACRRRRRSRRQLCRTRQREKHRAWRRTVAAGERGRHGRKFVVAFCQALRHRPRDRKRRRCREPVGHGRRRSLRVRRHQGRGARRQASRDGRGHRPAGAGPCRRGPRGDGGDLCLGRRRGAGARRSHAGQGCPQGRAAGRGADANGPAARRATWSTRRCCRTRSRPAR